jgi:hypothetical protein
MQTGVCVPREENFPHNGLSPLFSLHSLRRHSGQGIFLTMLNYTTLYAELRKSPDMWISESHSGVEGWRSIKAHICKVVAANAPIELILTICAGCKTEMSVRSVTYRQKCRYCVYFDKIERRYLSWF